MKKSLILSGVAALIIAATLGVAQAQKESSTNKKNVRIEARMPAA